MTDEGLEYKDIGVSIPDRAESDSVVHLHILIVLADTDLALQHSSAGSTSPVYINGKSHLSDAKRDEMWRTVFSLLTTLRAGLSYLSKVSYNVSIQVKQMAVVATLRVSTSSSWTRNRDRATM